MKLFYDLLPVLLFFAVYKLYGAIPPETIHALNGIPVFNLTPGKTGDAIFLATAVAIVTSFFQVSSFWLRHRRFEKMQIISLVLITVFGGATLLLRDPLFIKWKPTILNWVFALAFLGSQFLGEKTLIERLMGHAIQVPKQVWQRLNLAWVAFFVASGLANLAVAYSFSEETWVNFKLFGLMGMTLVFVLFQAFYLARYIVPAQPEADKNL